MAKLNLDTIPDEPLFVMARFIGIPTPWARKLAEFNRFLNEQGAGLSPKPSDPPVSEGEGSNGPR